jgi:hypothetical protein
MKAVMEACLEKREATDLKANSGEIGVRLGASGGPSRQGRGGNYRSTGYGDRHLAVGTADSRRN